jgi:hypothetical protein
MNDQIFATEIKAIFDQELLSLLGREAVDATHDTPEIIGYPFHITVGQTADSGARPLLVIYGEYKTYPRGYRMGKLHLMLRSHFGDEGALPAPPAEFTHQARFETIYKFLFGTVENDASQRSAVRFLVSQREKVEMFDYGLTAEESIECLVDGEELVTTIHMDVAFRHLQV